MWAPPPPEWSRASRWTWAAPWAAWKRPAAAGSLWAWRPPSASAFPSKAPRGGGRGRLVGGVEARGRGVFPVGVEAAKRIGLPIEGARVAVQGLGNVGGTAGKLFAQAGARVVE